MTEDGVSSFGDIVLARAPALLRLAVMLTGNRTDAEDLLQASLARASRHGARIAAMPAPAAYLRTVLVHEHLSAARTLRRRVRTTSIDGHEPAVESRADDAVDQRDETWRLLGTLPRKQRAVLVLRFYEDLPDIEIARVLECSEVTVRSNASRALAGLRERLTRPQEVRP